MSPEQWESSELTVKVDVYAFGILLHEIFSGEVPFDGCDFYDVRTRVGRGDRPRARAVSARAIRG